MKLIKKFFERVKRFLKMLKNLFLYVFFRKRMNKDDLRWTEMFLESFKHFTIFKNIKRFFKGPFFPEDFNYKYITKEIQ